MFTYYNENIMKQIKCTCRNGFSNFIDTNARLCQSTRGWEPWLRKNLVWEKVCIPCSERNEEEKVIHLQIIH